MLRRLAPERFSVVQRGSASNRKVLWTQAVQRSASKGPNPFDSPSGLLELLEPIRKSLTKKLLDYSEDAALRGPTKPFGQECSWSLLDRAPRLVKIMVPKSTPPRECLLEFQFAEP
jgi:hypothetical protein